ncbi:hypothetical protein DVA67_020300 [Solirubrobacter sp. CPCC 204708]|uniref:Uncharacterized protein n=1 Tax=Solirubrobacter deserti TaxID=2282478 RepID=A0ABT4RTN4_9ACTN|nr:hypothetical protein [Solirubrobacter deserti]MBE2318335.1 hypothetical protein [Solirubrobacter deserti]MDA0141934.1 hypothetical protein [Solirubrobacter deserti]
MSRSTKSLLTLLTAVTLAGAAAPAFADEDPPPPPTPLCYAADGTPIFDPVVCDAQRQASGH